jgi:hypothetical protein
MHLLKRGTKADLHTIDRPLNDDEPLSGIRCPLCGWRPSAASRWSCISVDGPEPSFEGCGTVWNTFSTRGRCPGCRHQWQWTSCRRCEEWSPHADWYEDPEI